MAVLPQSREERIAFFETRLTPWTDQASAIGLNSATMVSFTSLVTSARDALNEALAAREAAKSATQKYYNAVAAMDEPGRDHIATIKAYADSTNNPNVYVLAQIPPPAPPAPVPAPETPVNLRASIDASGTITLAWDAVPSGPSSGIIFRVSRRMAGETTFTFIGATFEKSFADAASVALEGPAAYRVQAQRGTQLSAFAGPLEINLGGGGGSFVSTAGFVGGSSAEAA